MMSPPGMMVQRTSGKAIAALVLGIIAFCIAIYLGIICGVIALILGILGMKEVDRNPTQVKGKGLAITGIVLGSIGIVLQVIGLIVLGAAFTQVFQCIDNPDAAGCEDFQNSNPMVPEDPSLPTEKTPGPAAWAWPTWTPLRIAAS
jgi:hypothetical protein